MLSGLHRPNSGPIIVVKIDGAYSVAGSKKPLKLTVKN